MLHTQLITTGQAALILGCSVENIRRLIRLGRLPLAGTVGRGQRLLERAAIETFLAEMSRIRDIDEDLRA